MFKTNRFLKLLFPKYIWELPNTEKKIYLTFDDGPIPEITEWVLELLKKEEIKATFFCIGDNVRKYPEIVQKIISNNHSIGNHTYSHLKGWKTPTKTYISNTKACEMKLNNLFKIQNSKLFRPPYGKITPWQSYQLRKLGYKIIMWDVLSYDFDNSLNPDDCLQNTLKNISNGSIIVFHDSIKARRNLQFVLPKLIQQLKEKGFIFDKIS